MLLRILAAVVFFLVGGISFLSWLLPRERSAIDYAADFHGFLIGLIGLILVDIAWSLHSLVRDRQREAAARLEVENTELAVDIAEAHARRQEQAETGEPWMSQQVTIDPKRVQRAVRASKRAE